MLLTTAFHNAPPDQYSQHDRPRGYYCTADRHGTEVTFQILSTSSAGITNVRRRLDRPNPIVHKVAEALRYVKVVRRNK